MTSTVAIALTLATAVNVAALVMAKAETETPKIVSAWLTYITSGSKGEVQHLITARYDAPDIVLAMDECRRDAAQTLVGIRKEPLLTLVVAPSCATEKPPWWID